MSGRARSPRRRSRLVSWLIVPALAVAQFMVAVALGTASAAPAKAADATPGNFSLAVMSEVDGSHSRAPSAPIPGFKWLISAEKTNGAYGYDPMTAGQPGYDGVGDPTNNASSFKQCTPGNRTSATDPGSNVGNGYDPAACQWPSVRYTPGAVPVVAEGDQTDVASGLAGIPDGTVTTLGADGVTRIPLTLKPGRYLISVTAEGYKIDGAHFDIDGTKGAAPVVVKMHAYPVPTGTLRLRVFQDTAPVDGTYEVGVEKPLAGFTVHLNDVLAEVTNDFFGNKLCTNYVHVTAADVAANTYPGQKVGDVALDPASGTPVIDITNPGGSCVTDASGDVAIPNLGPDRYTATVIAPTGQMWYQTTTLEGNHDWDMWIAEAESGFDTEQTVGNELVPPVDMGFVPFNPIAGQADSAPATFAAGGTTVKGTVVEINTYVGGAGGVTVPNAGVAGANVRGPVNQPIITLSDLDNNDQMVYVGRGAANGTFAIANVPDGNYQLTLWDYQQDLILDSFNVTVNAATAPKVGAVPTMDLGQKGLVDWYSTIRGTVFVDTNGNGKRDPGEPGVSKFPIGLKQRDNSLLDAGQNAAVSDDQGNYTVREVYPISKLLVLEAFDTRYKTTGITVQADNEPTSTTYLGAAVDVNVQAIIGLAGRVDWGVKPYGANENGGIVGTITYDSTRNELDPRYAVTEAYQPGIPGLKVHLYAPVSCDLTSTDPTLNTAPGYASGTASCGSDGYWHNGDGSIVARSDGSGKPIDLSQPYTSETWDQSSDCTARDHAGQPLTDQYALPPFNGVNNPSSTSYMCVEAPMLGWQAVPSDKSTGNFAQTVNGNYGFGTVDHDPKTGADLGGSQPVPNGDYIVKVDIPTLSNGRPLYQVTKEEDVNIFSGDVRLPQENFPLPATYTPPAGAQSQTGNQPSASQGAGIWSPCVGANHTVHVTDAAFLAGGGSPYEGQARPVCDEKLVTVRGAQSVAPNFNLFTPVPLPTHFWGLTINDLGLSQDKTQAGYGEAQPLPDVPMGIYDWSGRLVDTVTTDWNGMYEALEPSTSSYNCPLPAGPCPGMYYFKGNDPGQPGHLNANYNPRFRTIGTEFQAWPGLWTTTDTAPTQVGVIAVAPGTTQLGNVKCSVNDGTNGAAAAVTPDIMAISQPYMSDSRLTPGSPLTSTQAVITGSSASRTVTLALAAGNSTIPAGTVVTVSGLGAPYDATKAIAVGKPGGTGLSNATPTISYRVAATANQALHAASGQVVRYSTAANTTQAFAVKGYGFGSAPSVTLTNAGGVSTTVPATGGNTQLTFTLTRSAALVPGAYQLTVTNHDAGNGRSSVNGLTFHLLGTGYNPTLIQVNPGATTALDSGSPLGQALNFPSTAFPAVINGDPNTNPEDVLQKAIDAAAGVGGQALVVVWPNQKDTNNPAGEYFENVVVHSAVKLQGIGAGGTFTDAGGTSQHVDGTQLDGIGFNPDNLAGSAWVAKVASLTTDNVPDSAVVTVLGNRSFAGSYKAQLDGMTVTGGSQADFATAINDVYGGATTPVGAPNALVTQGGGIYLHTQANYMTISNNVIVGNSGSYGGAIRIGTPYTAVEGRPNTWSVPTNLKNTHVTISHNRIRDNGGTNLAGGIGIFDGSDNYSVDHNDLCGNFSAEYGGGLTQYGLSNSGLIQHNRVYLNGSYDEGGGIMMAGELNPNLSEPSAGVSTSGRTVIDANLVQDNLANDDGGGVRFLQAGNRPIDLTNNMIDDNVSAHEGGGIALDDTTNVNVTGNTVMNNLTTATAVTSTGSPAPAGLSTGANSDQLQATLGMGQNVSLYSRPQTFKDNIFWGNLAGTWDPGTGSVLGITAGGTGTNAPNEWDLGSVDALQRRGTTGSGPQPQGLIPTNSVLYQNDPQVTPSPTNLVSTVQPQVIGAYRVNVQIISSRTFPSFREAAIVANAVAPNVQGDYHLTASGAPARGNGDLSGVPPTALFDFDGQGRPLGTGPDIGADEIP